MGPALLSTACALCPALRAFAAASCDAAPGDQNPRLRDCDSANRRTEQRRLLASHLGLEPRRRRLQAAAGRVAYQGSGAGSRHPGLRQRQPAGQRRRAQAAGWLRRATSRRRRWPHQASPQRVAPQASPAVPKPYSVNPQPTAARSNAAGQQPSRLSKQTYGTCYTGDSKSSTANQDVQPKGT